MDAHRFWVAAGLPAVSWVKAGGELGRDVPRCRTGSTPSLLGTRPAGVLGQGMARGAHCTLGHQGFSSDPCPNLAHPRASPSPDWPVRGAMPGSAASLHERGQDLAGLTQPQGPNKHVWMSCSFGMRNTDVPRSLAGSQAALPGARKITHGHQAEGQQRAPAWQEPPCLSCQLQGQAEPICVSETG